MDLQAGRLEDTKRDMNRVRVILYNISEMNFHAVSGVKASGTDFAAVAMVVRFSSVCWVIGTKGVYINKNNICK